MACIRAIAVAVAATATIAIVDYTLNSLEVIVVVVVIVVACMQEVLSAAADTADIIRLGSHMEAVVVIVKEERT